ncbi:hypothetical protein KC318_g13890 [Hortaea werneckii]|nr:hypothetical protein KC334_g17012 [Hortaea werneckii]KAI7653972.1 hypothetical protein KC318_g13890 [Hortaea werneckii]
MAEEEAPRNRRERRAAAKESGKPIEAPTQEPKIRTMQPDRSGPKGKTLLDLYETRKLYSTKANLSIPSSPDEEPIGPLGQAVFWAVSLGMLHFTLDVLVYQQYAQEILWSAIFRRTFTGLPILFLLIFMLRSETADRFPNVRQLFYLVVGVSAGCYTIHAANRYDYFAVMKQAPPLGTIWIWSVIEMRLPVAALSVLANVGFLWWRGYSIT